LPPSVALLMLPSTVWFKTYVARDLRPMAFWNKSSTARINAGAIIHGLRIEEIAFGGAGVARSGGKVVFVPFTIEEEIVDVRVVESRRSFDLGRLEAVRKSSEHRMVAPCPFFQDCGGCDYQHITYTHQLGVKQNQIAQVLARIAKLSGFEVKPVVPSPKTFGFRNRIVVHCDQDKIGFFKKQSRTIVDIPQCLIASDAVNAKLREFRAGRPRPGTHSTIRERDQITTFSQTNDGVAALLMKFVRAQVKGRVVLDVYCGAGFFAHDLADLVEKVVGIDWSEPAIRQARRLANNNETYLCGDAGELLDGILEKEGPSTVILDPSATGISEDVVVSLTRRPPPQLIYVSCNPATFARDIHRLSPAFRLQAVQPFDMFPQTAEIEVVGVLERI
jgi:23S rRNA (uracil1939-C5)-methyltransferase